MLSFFSCLSPIQSFLLTYKSPLTFVNCTLSSLSFLWQWVTLFCNVIDDLQRIHMFELKTKGIYRYACPFMVWLVECQIGRHERLVG